MIRRLPPAIRRGSAALLTLVVSYLLAVEFLRLLGMNRLAPGPFPVDRLILIVSSITCGIRRVAAFHPIYNPDYRRWLEATPWTHRKPLPMGPVAPTWGDGLYMAAVILLSAMQAEPRAMQLVCYFLMGHVLALLPTLWLGSWAIGYLTAAGLGLTVRLFYSPIACLGAATVTYLVAYEGLRRALERFPWSPSLRAPNAQNLTGDPVVECVREVGWPYGPMLADVGTPWRISRIDAVLGCLLLSWWLDCIGSLVPDPRNRQALLAIVAIAIMLVPFVRLGIYVRGYAAPLTIWGRIRMFRPIVPGYDRVFIGPICSLLAGPMTMALLTSLRAPLEVGLAISYGMVVLIALLTPPSLRRWRLTGAHRMVPTMTQAQGQNQAQAPYVRVG